MVVLDVESYVNYFLIAFKRGEKVTTFELRGNNCFTEAQRIHLRKVMKNETFGFNSNRYDIPMIVASLDSKLPKSPKELNKLSNKIIIENTLPWNLDLDIPDYNHFDIKDVGQGVMISLKLYGARIHTRKLQDLPISPEQTLSESDMDDIKEYCINDLDVTIDLANAMQDRIQLRRDMGKRYGIDLMSKSDAQIAEAVFRNKLGNIRPPKFSGHVQYTSPDYISFKCEQLNDLLTTVNRCEFKLLDNGAVKLPSELSKRKITLGRSTYKIGIGGIHSTEKCQTIIPKKGQRLLDRDVAAYYPSLILNLNLAPKHLKDFTSVYREIVDERIAAKRSGNKIVNESLKITINGSFGKLGSQYSMLYSPDMLLAVTLTGQLSLLMLIEKLEIAGIRVVSANTDGFVSIVPDELYDIYDTICFDWELDSNLELEETEYTALHSRDVNNYIAITGDSYKGKGIFTTPGLGKNPQAPICQKAVAEYLTNGTPIINTIYSCVDVTQFISARTVNGGARWRDLHLGRVVRWVYSTDGDTIHYIKNNNKVPLSDNAQPLPILDGIPDNMDYDAYVTIAEKVLKDVGA